MTDTLLNVRMNTARDRTNDHGWIAKIAQTMNLKGFRLVRAERGTMDSGIAVFSNGTDEIEVVRDRSQWMLQGGRKELEPHGLFRAYNDDDSFIDALYHWIEVRKCEPKAARERRDRAAVSGWASLARRR